MMRLGDGTGATWPRNELLEGWPLHGVILVVDLVDRYQYGNERVSMLSELAAQ